MPRSVVTERSRATDLHEDLRRYDAQIEILRERIGELEYLNPDLDIAGWDRLGGGSGMDFSRDHLDRIIRLSRLNYLKNPLMNHAIDVQAHYVFSDAAEVSAGHPDINDVVQAFWEDYDNRKALTSHQSMLMKERTLSHRMRICFSCSSRRHEQGASNCARSVSTRYGRFSPTPRTGTNRGSTAACGARPSRT